MTAAGRPEPVACSQRLWPVAIFRLEGGSTPLVQRGIKEIGRGQPPLCYRIS